jgi:4-hydroxybenzoate polyprenyltransferase
MVIILKTIDYVSYYYLPKKLQKILEMMVIIVSLYTPILKKIPLVKNITCASIISFAIFFAGLSTNNKPLLYIASIYIFLGSLMNELLLDIRDYDGDKQNKIYTIPVIFGKQNTLKICYNILRFNILLNSSILLSFYNIFTMIPFLIINFNYYFRIKNNSEIKEIVNQSNIPLFMTLIYFCYIK